VFSEPIALDDFVAAVEAACERRPQVFAGGDRPLSSVGIVTGGGQKLYHEAVAAGLDGYVTGEATEWVMHQAIEDRVHYLAAGHYATERFGIQALGRWLRDRHHLEVEYIELTNPV
jgi:putative NIF3 family GTP cyclohydrolase 1 type 2